MRSRNLKPGFFKNEDLAECSPWARLCFEGLWLLADRAGRLVNRPKRIKGELFAYDSIEIEPLLDELEAHHFILRYEALDGTQLIQVLQFLKHQNPHRMEAQSQLPPPESPGLYPPGTTTKPGKDAASSPSHAPKASDKPQALPPSQGREAPDKPEASLRQASDSHPLAGGSNPADSGFLIPDSLSQGGDASGSTPLEPTEASGSAATPDPPPPDKPAAPAAPAAPGAPGHRLELPGPSAQPPPPPPPEPPPTPPPDPPPELARVIGTAAGRICKALRQAGIAKVNPSHPKLQGLIEAGATEEEFLAAAERAQGKNEPFSYVLSLVENDRRGAKEMLEAVHHGPMPGSREARDWTETAGGVKAKGAEVGVPYTSKDACSPFPVYKARVLRAVSQGEQHR